MTYHPLGGTGGDPTLDQPPAVQDKICSEGPITTTWTLTQNPDPIVFHNLAAHGTTVGDGKGLPLGYPYFEPIELTGLPEVGDRGYLGRGASNFMEQTLNLGLDIGADLGETYFGSKAAAVGTAFTGFSSGFSYHQVALAAYNTQAMQDAVTAAQLGVGNIIDSSFEGDWSTEALIGLNFTETDFLDMTLTTRTSQELGRWNLLRTGAYCVDAVDEVLVNTFYQIPLDDEGRGDLGFGVDYHAAIQLYKDNANDPMLSVGFMVGGDMSYLNGYETHTDLVVGVDIPGVVGEVWGWITGEN